MASARALTDVELELVQKDTLDHYEKLPKWTHILINEFSLRLNQVNNLFATNHNSLDSELSMEEQFLFFAEQIASFSAEVAEKYSFIHEEEQIIGLDDLMNLCSKTLKVHIKTVEQIFAAYIEHDLLQTFMLNINKPHIKIKKLNGLKWFSDFVGHRKYEGVQKLINSQLSYKERTTLYHLHSYCVQRKFHTDTEITLLETELSENFENTVHYKYQKSAINKAIELNLIDSKIKANGERQLFFIANQMSRSIISLNVLLALNEISLSQKDFLKTVV